MDYYKLSIKRIHLEKNKRIICISDIHGGYDLLVELLNKINYTKDDYLFIIGDIIEKGPKSLLTLQYIMDLSKNKNTYVLMGNNDLICLDIYNDNYIDYIRGYVKRCKSIYHDFADKLNIKLDDNTDFLKLNSLIRKKFKKEIDFIKNLPTIIETDNLLFAHASITDYNNMSSLNVNEVLKYDYFMRGEFYLPKRLIVGHYPSVAYNYERCSLSPVTNIKKNITSIDGGYTAKIGGQLNALVFDSENSLNESYFFTDDLPKYECLKSCSGKKPSILGIFAREKFEVLEFNEKESRCLINNQECTIPNEFIYLDKGIYYCADYTNEILSFEKGEKIGVVIRYENKSFIKKGDTLGFTDNENILWN